MRKAVEAFEHDFARWDLHLPADAVDARRGGHIPDAGWSILYEFGHDPKGEYLDYYASPRDVTDDPPGDDWHVRLYGSGDRAVLPTVLEAYMYGRDPSAEELERTRRQYVDRLTGLGSDGAPLGERTAAAPSLKPPSMAGDATATVRTDRPIPAPARPVRAATRSLDSERRPAPRGDDQDSASASPFADSTGDVQYLPLDIGLDVDLALTPPGMASVGGSAGDPSAPPQSVKSFGSASPPPAPETNSPPESLDASSSVASDDDDIGDDLPASLPASAIDEVRRGGLVLFFPTSDDTPTEFGAAQQPWPLSEPATPPASTDAEEVDELVVVPATGPDQEAGVDGNETEGDTASDKEWSLAASEDDGSLLHGISPPPVDAATDTPEHAAPPVVAGPPPPPPPPAKKVFARADLVLTQDVATIMGSTDPDSFRPWWNRSGSRRIVIAVAAAAVVAAGVLTVIKARWRSAPTTIGREIDSTEADKPLGSTPGQGPAATPSDSAAPSDSQPQAATPGADSAVPTPRARQDAPPATASPSIGNADGGGHAADDGVARPSGPGSLPPIIPSSTSRHTGRQ